MPPVRRRRPNGQRALADAVQAMLDEIAAGETALQRAELATWFIELCAQAQGQLASARVEPVGKLRRAGWSTARMARGSA